MSERSHRLILASAGTGKTYQLSGRFLGLLVQGVEPDKILATTFTRKAAGEILDRVLERLVDSAADAKKRDELSAQLKGFVGKPVTEKQARALLVQLTRQIDRFRIRTLDAFFVQLAKLFALDLGLPADWSIVDEVDDQRMRRDALARAVAATDREEMLVLLRALQRGDMSRDVERRLNAVITQGRAAFLDSAPEAWRQIQAPPGLDASSLSDVLGALRRIDAPLTKAGEPSKVWVKALDGAAKCAEGGDWRGFVKGGITAKLLAGETTYSRAEITEEMYAVFGHLITHARHEIVSAVAAENEANRAWLTRFESAYSELKREQRAYRFEDLPQALAPSDFDPLGDRDLDLYYRLDARIDHLLLDEFQDTAAIQWRILARLAEEILADFTGDRTYFCVGDVKQSIYGWREAEPRLLSEQAERYPILDPAEELSESYRSSSVVLDTVNTVFSSIETNAAIVAAKRVVPAHAWREGFREHVSARAELTGAAYLVEARPPREGESADLPTLELAADRAAQIATESPGATVGILLRRNHHLSRIIYLLRKRGHRASGSGGNPLVDSEVVLQTIALMHLADHPGDSAAAFHVAMSPLAKAFEESSSGRLEADPAAAARLAHRVRNQLGTLGYGGFLSSLRGFVVEECGAWDRKRFDQLIDLAYAWEERAGLRSSDFVDHVRATKVEDPSAEQIKVMTIHASKGLEFDAVILPELDGKPKPDLGLLTLRPDPAGPLTAVSVRPPSAVQALDPNLVALAEGHAERDLKEQLCVLYVAMTRAARRLDMLTRAPGKAGFSFSALLRAAFDAGEPGEDGVLWTSPASDPNCLGGLGDTETSSPVAANERPTIRLRESATDRSAPQFSPSGQEAAGPIPVEMLLRSGRSEARVRGTLIHRWFEEVEWLDDFDVSDAELLAIGAEIEPSPQVRKKVLARFRALLCEEPALRLLTRPSPAEEVEVWRERRFALHLPGATGPEFWSGAFDRVTVHRQAGVATSAVILDYKTDAVDESGVDARFEVYRPQLEAYRQVLCQMEGLAAEQVAATALFLEAGIERSC